MKELYAGIACNLDRSILEAALPLFDKGLVDCIEWSFDTLYKHSVIPPWFSDLLLAFGEEGRLVGHGVFFSLFSGRWTSSQQEWLEHLRVTTEKYHLDHVSEHFGFMTGQDFHHGAPLSLPFNTSTLQLGIDRLKLISQACSKPVGLENLAFAYSIEEVKKHGDFLSQLLTPVNGFMILDLHNLYCHIHNFQLNYDEIIDLYDLSLVREIHISGGSWDNISEDSGKKIRRDTHDDGVPEEVFSLLRATIPKCENLKFVILEQLGIGLKSEESKSLFRSDFNRMKEIVKHSFLPKGKILNSFHYKCTDPTKALIYEDEQLMKQQDELSVIIENANSIEDAKIRLENSSLSRSDWRVEEWSDEMLLTALKIAQKWKDGWPSHS